MAEEILPLVFVKTEIKDIFIGELKRSFHGNHYKYPDLAITEQYADVNINFEGVIISTGPLKITPAGLGDIETDFWYEEIESGTRKVYYRTDNYIFDATLKVSVGARDSINRDGIVDAISRILLWDTDFRSRCRDRGLEIETNHSWQGDNEVPLGDESVDDRLFTDQTDLICVGEVYVRKDPITNIVEGIVLVPYTCGYPDPLPEGYWMPPEDDRVTSEEFQGFMEQTEPEEETLWYY